MHAVCIHIHSAEDNVTCLPSLLPWHDSLLGGWGSRITQVSVYGQGFALKRPTTFSHTSKELRSCLHETPIQTSSTSTPSKSMAGLSLLSVSSTAGSTKPVTRLMMSLPRRSARLKSGEVSPPLSPNLSQYSTLVCTALRSQLRDMWRFLPFYLS